jgi:hypothetical protein
VACASQKGMMTAGTRLAQEWNLWSPRNGLSRTTCPQIPSNYGRPDSPSSRHIYFPKHNQNNCITIWYVGISLEPRGDSLCGWGKELSVPGHQSEIGIVVRGRPIPIQTPAARAAVARRQGALPGFSSGHNRQRTAHNTSTPGPCTSLFFAMDELMPTLIFGAEIQPSFSALGNY